MKATALSPWSHARTLAISQS